MIKRPRRRGESSNTAGMGGRPVRDCFGFDIEKARLTAVEVLPVFSAGACACFTGKVLRSKVGIFGQNIAEKARERDAAGAETDAWKKARDYGIDIVRLEYLLTLSPAERLRRHDLVRPLVAAARRAGIRHYGFDPRLAGSSE